MKWFIDLENMLAGAATVACYLVECDGASSNDKCMWYRFGLLPARALNILRLCMNHQLHLTEAMMLGCAMGFTGSLYRVGKLLRTSGYYLRLIAKVEQVISKVLMIRSPKDRPEDIHEFNLLLRDLVVRNFGIGRLSEHEQARRAALGQGPPSSPGKAKYIETWDALLVALPDCMAGDMVHYCSGCGDGIGATSRERCVKSVSVKIVDVVFRNMPGQPEAGKWAKTFPLLLWLTVGFGIFGTLPLIWSAALVPMKGKPKRGVESHDPDAVNWGEIFNKRALASERLLQDKFQQHLVIMYCIVMEPIKWLTDQFIAGTKQCKLAMNLTQEAYSPVYHVMQYLSTLLAGACGRSRLLFGFARCASFVEYISQGPGGAAAAFRKLIFAASGGIYRRLHRVFTNHPMKLLGLGDSRVSDAALVDICTSFVKKRWCCLDWGFRQGLEGTPQAFYREQDVAAKVEAVLLCIGLAYYMLDRECGAKTQSQSDQSMQEQEQKHKLEILLQVLSHMRHPCRIGRGLHLVFLVGRRLRMMVMRWELRNSRITRPCLLLQRRW